MVESIDYSNMGSASGMPGSYSPWPDKHNTQISTTATVEVPTSAILVPTVSKTELSGSLS